LRIKLWGVRGSIPAPLDTNGLVDKIEAALSFAQKEWKKKPTLTVDEMMKKLPESSRQLVGGETTCVEVNLNGTTIIIDMGSGARRLGYDLMARKKRGEFHVLMTHTHWDHIQGWPFFVPAYIPGNTIHFYSTHADLQSRFETQQHFDFFPLPFDGMASEKQFHTFQSSKTFQVGPFSIDTLPLPHPGGSVSFRIATHNRIFILATDAEFYGVDKVMLRKNRPFFNGADLLVIDAQYSREEAEKKVGWGHTSVHAAVECAIEWNIKKLVLTHHEPSYTDDTIEKLFKEAKLYKKQKFPDASLKIFQGRQDDEYTL